MRVGDLNKKLHQTVPCAIEKGWTIKPGGFGSEETKICCPLSTILICEDKNLTEELGKVAFEDNMGLTHAQMQAFYRGFDNLGNSKNPRASYGKLLPYYNLGMRMRHELGFGV